MFREPPEEATSSATEHIVDQANGGWTRCACGANFYDATASANHFWDAGYEKGREDERRLRAPDRR